MNRILGIAFLGILLMGCKEEKNTDRSALEKVEFDVELANELKEMAKIDQIAAYIPQGKYKEWSKEKWNAFKDSVFEVHQKRIETIFNENGFVGFDLAGKEGSGNFWLMVQHSDHDPEFQERVLEKMKVQVEKNNADPVDYGYLVDRVKLNTGKQQVYGTQVDYNFEISQAYAKNLMDSVNVNNRRAAIGLEPLEVYLNDMSQSHFQMNKQFYLGKGVTEPILYMEREKSE